jgi:3-hydroxyisobutyrate dehydrogenase-like beta-hydroxyacid dehydrogenase
MNELGQVGLGLLGSALAETFLRAGFRVRGFDLAAERRAALAERGGLAVAALADLAGCGRLVLCLPHSDAVECVVAELLPVLRPGTVVVDTTTGDPGRTTATGAALATRGIDYLDATVAGSSAEVRAGGAVVMVGGRREAVAGCADLFRCFAREWFHLGPAGSGARMKLMVNLVLGLNRAALAEGLAFARVCGIDPGEALRVLKAGAAYSRAMDAKGEKMVRGDFAPVARLAQHLKDVRLILAEAERAGACVPLSALHAGLLQRLADAGFGDEDNSAIIRAFSGEPGCVSAGSASLRSGSPADT